MAKKAKTYAITLDMFKDSYVDAPVLVCGDSGNVFTITLVDGSSAFSATGCDIVITISSKSGSRQLTNGTDANVTIADNVLTVTIPEGCYDIGANICDVAVYSSDETNEYRVTSAWFLFSGRASLSDGTASENAVGLDILHTLIKAIENVTASATTLSAQSAATATASITNQALTFLFGLPAGAAGTDGTDGSIWFSGTAVTGTGTGISATVAGSAAGDYYLNTTTAAIYVATAANVWSYLFAISSAVSSVNTQTGDVVLTASEVGADASGTAASAILEHTSSPTAHVEKFADCVTFDYLATCELANQADWDENDASAHGYILNKPTIPTTTSELANDSGYATESYVAASIAAKQDTFEVLNDEETVGDATLLDACTTMGIYKYFSEGPYWCWLFVSKTDNYVSQWLFDGEDESYNSRLGTITNNVVTWGSWKNVSTAISAHNTSETAHSTLLASYATESYVTSAIAAARYRCDLGWKVIRNDCRTAACFGADGVCNGCKKCRKRSISGH